MFSFLILLLEVFQVVIATVASIVFLMLAGLTLAGSAAALTITTPLFIIFSPILVPATIATAVLTTGFTASGTLGAMAVSLIRPRMRLRPRRRSFSGTLGNIRSGGTGLRRLRGLLGGKSFPGTIPFGGTPLGGTPGSNPASGGTPEAGAGLGGLLGGAIPGLFGGTPGSNPASGGTPAAGAGTPAAGAGTPEAGAGLGGLLGGTIPGLFGGTPGSNPASGGTPAAGAKPAGGSTPPW